MVRTRAGNAASYEVFGKTYHIMTDSQGYQARGQASWYGTKFHGRPTANGEIYDMYAMTAAHKTLPIPSYVRVTNVNNGKTVVVKVNDRGPFVDDRLIDLSYAAAKRLEMDRVGVATVEIIDITPTDDQPVLPSVPDSSRLVVAADISSTSRSPEDQPEIDGNPGLYLQLGAFQESKTAASLKSRILALIKAPVIVRQGRDLLHRVSLGPANNEQSLYSWQKILEANGLGPGFLVRQ